MCWSSVKHATRNKRKLIAHLFMDMSIYFKSLSNIRLSFDIYDDVSMDLKLGNAQLLPFHSLTFRLQI